MGRVLFHRLIAVLLGLAVAVGLAEGGLRVVGIGYGHSPIVSDAVMHHVHPKDYRFLAHKPSGEYGGFPVYYDDEGRVSDPERRFQFDPSAHRRIIAVLGDSHVEALQVPYGRSFVGLLNEGSADDVLFLNFAVSSYSVPFCTCCSGGTRARLRVAHVLVFLFSNDVAGDEGLAPDGVFTAGELLAVPGPGGGGVVRQLRKSYVVRLIRRYQLRIRWLRENRGRELPVVGGYVEESPPIRATTSEYLLTLAREVHATGARFTLTAVPSKAPAFVVTDLRVDTAFADRVKAWAARNGIDYLDLQMAFRVYADTASDDTPRPFFERDIHFNETGHAIVFEEIRRHFPEYFDARAPAGWADCAGPARGDPCGGS